MGTFHTTIKNLSGKIIGQSSVYTYQQESWPWIKEVVTVDQGKHPSYSESLEFQTVEMDDGTEAVVLDGEIVAYVHDEWVSK